LFGLIDEIYGTKNNAVWQAKRAKKTSPDPGLAALAMFCTARRDEALGST
jgi:hypothetical protein